MLFRTIFPYTIQALFISHASPLEAPSFLKNSRGMNIYLQYILCLIYGGWSLVVYINVTGDQLLSIFCLSEVLKDFYSISKKLYMLLNTEDKGFYYLKKILYIRDVKNTQRHTLCHQDCSSSCFAALCSLQGRGWKQGCSCGCFVPQFGAWPCLWLRNTLLCWSPEITNDSGKVKGKCCDCAHPR